MGEREKVRETGGPSPLPNLPLFFHFSPSPPSTVTPVTQARGGVTPYNGLFGKAPKIGRRLIFRTVAGHRAHPKRVPFIQAGGILKGRYFRR